VAWLRTPSTRTGVNDRGGARAARGGVAEYFEPSTGEPLGSKDQSWSVAVALEFKGQHELERKVEVISKPEQERNYRVGISGSYGGMNLGDEAILEAIVSELRRRVPVEVVVFGMNPKDTLAHHDVERAMPVREMSSGEAAREI
jgi:hypothetical protein